MGMFGPGKEGWLAEAEMLSWAFRHLKAEERDYLTKRLKHVLGKRTLKGSWFEKDKSLVEMLVAGPAHRAGLGSLPLMTAANTEKMHALDYPGLSEDKTPEAFFRRVEAAATHEKSKEAMRAFHEEIDGTPYDRRAFAMLIIYICGFGLSWYAKAFLERYCREFGANSQTTLSISFDPSLYEGKDGILKAKRRPQARSPKSPRRSRPRLRPSLPVRPRLRGLGRLLRRRGTKSPASRPRRLPSLPPSLPPSYLHPSCLCPLKGRRRAPSFRETSPSPCRPCREA